MSFAIFLPLIAAACYGMSYITLERVFKSVDVLTYMFLGALFSAAVVVFAKFWLFYTGRDDSPMLSFEFGSWQNIAFITLAIFTMKIGFLATGFAIKEVSATYASLGELSYPIFIVLFGWLFFGVRQWDWTTLAGGALIMAGAFLMVWGKSKA